MYTPKRRFHVIPSLTTRDCRIDLDLLGKISLHYHNELGKSLHTLYFENAFIHVHNDTYMSAENAFVHTVCR